MIDPSFWGPWGYPATILEYGETGDGKTGDDGYAFHSLAAYIGEPAHIKSVAALTGIPMSDLWIIQARRLSDVTEALPQIADSGCIAVVIDDLSVLARSSFTYYEDTAPRGKSGAKDGFYAHTETGKDAVRMRDRAREVGLHVAWNAHMDPPDTDMQGRARKGGPQMPNGKLRAQIPVIADLTVRTRKDVTRTVGWKGVFDCDERDPAWHMRDRHGIAPRTGPLNLGELLRAAGYILPRPDHIEVFEAEIQTASEYLDAGEPWSKVRPLMDELINSACATFNNDHREIALAWVLRDTYDRHALRKARLGKRLAIF